MKKFQNDKFGPKKILTFILLIGYELSLLENMESRDIIIDIDSVS